MKNKILWTFILFIVSVTVLSFVDSENNSDLFDNPKYAAQAYEEDNSTKINSTIQSCNCVAFRLDDIMDNKKTDAQIEVINTFMEKKVPLTIGITANKFGEDSKLVDFIKEQLKENNLEIANHGWDHEAFPIYTKKSQSNLIKQSNEKLYDVLGISPKVFIPPFNSFDITTINALKDNHMTHMSSAFMKDSSPYPLSDEMFYRFPAGADTGTEDGWTGAYLVLTHMTTFSNVETSLEKYGFAVVMMHPKEFTMIENGEFTDEINWDQINELKLLIQKIQDSNITIVPIGKINLDSNIQSIPIWIKNNAGMWAEDQIDDGTFVSGIQFLAQEGILRIPPTQQDGVTGDSEIPIWIKNNAGWWADNNISDNEFINSIQYLIKANIIKLNN